MNIILLFFDFLNPAEIIRIGGLTVLLAIVFFETGVFFGFFLPGDSLLFTAGLLCTSHLQLPVWELIVYVIIAAVSGSTVGYLTGRWAHAYLRRRPENFFYKQEYIDVTKAFYKKYGAMAFILGRFLPVVRTFVTIMSGMARINFNKFLLFNFLGVSIWVLVMVLSGHLLGQIFPNIHQYIGYIVLAMVVITAIPVIVSWRSRKQILTRTLKTKPAPLNPSSPE